LSQRPGTVDVHTFEKARGALVDETATVEQRLAAVEEELERMAGFLVFIGGQLVSEGERQRARSGKPQ
jgi:hypothetical protein